MEKMTLLFLDQFEPCDSQTKLFAETFPNGAEVTEANVRKAFEVGLNIGWLVTEMLDTRGCVLKARAHRQRLNAAEKVRRETVAAAYAEFHEKTEKALLSSRAYREADTALSKAIRAANAVFRAAELRSLVELFKSL